MAGSWGGTPYSQSADWAERRGVRAKSLQSCLTPGDPMDYGPPGSSVHGILQARILEWIAIPFFKLVVIGIHI